MRNNLLDKTKGVLIILVLMVHIGGFIMAYYDNAPTGFDLYRPIGNLPVAFFAGMTAYHMAPRDTNYYSNYIKGCLKLWFKMTALYLVVNLLLGFYWEVYVYNSTLVDSFVHFWQERDWIMVLNGTIGSYHLWYLMALFFGVFIFSILKKYMSHRAVFIISLLIYIASLHCLTEDIWSDILVSGGMPRILMFLSVGFMAYHHRDKIKIPSATGTAIILISFIIYYVIVFAGYTYYSQVILIVPVYIMLNLIYSRQSNSSILSYIGRYYSPIYMYHVLFISLYSVLIFNISAFGIDGDIILTVVMVVGGILFSLLVQHMLSGDVIQGGIVSKQMKN